MRQGLAWAVLVASILAVAPLLYYGAFRGWLAGGPPTTPERREVHEVWYFACLAAAVVTPIVGIVVFRRLRRRPSISRPG